MPLVWTSSLGSISGQASNTCQIKRIFLFLVGSKVVQTFCSPELSKRLSAYSAIYQHCQFSIQINERWFLMFFCFCKMLHFKCRLIGCFSTKELLKKKAYCLFCSEYGISEFSRKCMLMWQRIGNVLMSTLHNCDLVWNTSHFSWTSYPRYVFLGFLLAWFQRGKCLWRQLFFYQGKSF